MMLDGERVQSYSIWIRILALMREFVLSGEIVAMLGKPENDAEQSAKTLCIQNLNSSVFNVVLKMKCT